MGTWDAATDLETCANLYLGDRPDTDESFAADKAAVVTYAPKYPKSVYAITVGSETMYRGNFTGDQLLAKIKDVKSAVPQFKVGTADSWNKYQDGTADPLIKGGVDILLCNAFSYWQGQTVANATKSFFDDIMQAFGHIQATAGSLDKAPELWVGETGRCSFLYNCTQKSCPDSNFIISSSQDGQPLAPNTKLLPLVSPMQSPSGQPVFVAFWTGVLMSSHSRPLTSHGSQ